MNIKEFVFKALNKIGLYVYFAPVQETTYVMDVRRNVVGGSSGVLHIGASRGQEAQRYFESNLPVIWVEAIPSVYQELQENISKFENQSAYCALLGDIDGKEVNFNIASNQGESSSIFDLSSDHGFLNGELTMSGKLSLTMKRLDSMFTKKDLETFSHWVVDVQGAEALVLKGAGELLEVAQSLEIEVSTRKVYEGGAMHSEMVEMLGKLGFVPLWTFPENAHGDLMFVRTRANRSE